MGYVVEFPRHSRRVSQPPVFGLATTLVERDGERGTRAVLEIEGLATFCAVAEIPVAGDVVQAGMTTAIVETVRVTRGGHVAIRARRVPSPVDDARAGEVGEGLSPRVEAVLREMRRRRDLRSHRREPSHERPQGA